MTHLDTETEALRKRIEELEATEAKLPRLRAALRFFINGYDRDNPVRTADFHTSDCSCMRCIRDVAQTALEGK